MARGLNKVMLIGNLGQEPQVTNFQTGNGGKVANVSLVTDEQRYNSQTGNYEPVAEWHRLVFWNKLADTVQQFLHKGARIYAEGKLRTRKYTDKQGVERYTTEIYVDQLVMLGGGNGDQIPNPDPGYGTTNQGPQDNNWPSNNRGTYGANNRSNVYNNAAVTPAPVVDSSTPIAATDGNPFPAGQATQTQGISNPDTTTPNDEIPF